MVGDEAQTVRPTEFEWRWPSDVLHFLVGTPSEYKLASNLFDCYCARFTAATRPGYGLTAFPLHHSLSGPNSKIAKCRCGARGSAFPVDPTKPMTSPLSTRIPSRNPSTYPSKCA